MGSRLDRFMDWMERDYLFKPKETEVLDEPHNLANKVVHAYDDAARKALMDPSIFSTASVASAIDPLVVERMRIEMEELRQQNRMLRSEVDFLRKQKMQEEEAAEVAKTVKKFRPPLTVRDTIEVSS